MVKPVFTILFCFIAPLIFSQTLVFDYDKAGNQIERKLQSTSSPSARFISVLPPLKPLVEEKKISDYFTVSPSPTRGPVMISWDKQYKNRVVNILLSNYLGLREKVPFDPQENKTTFDLTTKNQGVYLIIFYLDNGMRIEKKISRQN